MGLPYFLARRPGGGELFISRLNVDSRYPSVSIRMKRYETLEYHYEISSFCPVAGSERQ